MDLVSIFENDEVSVLARLEFGADDSKEELRVIQTEVQELSDKFSILSRYSTEWKDVLNPISNFYGEVAQKLEKTLDNQKDLAKYQTLLMRESKSTTSNSRREETSNTRSSTSENALYPRRVTPPLPRPLLLLCPLILSRPLRRNPRSLHVLLDLSHPRREMDSHSVTWASSRTLVKPL